MDCTLFPGFPDKFMTVKQLKQKLDKFSDDEKVTVAFVNRDTHKYHAIVIDNQSIVVDFENEMLNRVFGPIWERV